MNTSLRRALLSSFRRRCFSNFVLPGDQSAFDALTKQDGKVILYYTASWCPPCKTISPIYEKLSKSYSGITFAKIDVDALPGAADFANIRSVPTFQFRNGGDKVAEFSGADAGRLEQQIKQLNDA
eukprot:CAMPEP_0185018148 /NCGR_PEP_ID=MMETSP1103-20130426/970_1 /TAXON_ID=36769 /ORGANISM="Paraphysomonas bandaiensis, Strain Caron Lab Isolate" /LENGTH=124 /DNA_ID=CAMNT_0027547865 /DNA_START=1 /DNA_END=378 /DNA_ORIENTATION=+